MATDAGPVLYHREPFALGDLLGDVAVATEPARLGDLQHRVPVDGRIDTRGLRLVARQHCGEIEELAWFAIHFRRVAEAIAAHPNLVLRLRQVADHISPRIIAD